MPPFMPDTAIRRIRRGTDSSSITRKAATGLVGPRSFARRSFQRRESALAALANENTRTRLVPAPALGSSTGVPESVWPCRAGSASPGWRGAAVAAMDTIENAIGSSRIIPRALVEWYRARFRGFGHDSCSCGLTAALAAGWYRAYMSGVDAAALVIALIWIDLLVGRGFFWWTREARLASGPASPRRIAVVIPA